LKTTITIIFPHQLFKQHPILEQNTDVYLIEEHLFFKQYNFHKTKISFHRATMKYYVDYLNGLGLKVHYIDSYSEEADIRTFIKQKAKEGVTDIHYINPVDNWLEKRITSSAKSNNIVLHQYETSNFINTAFLNLKRKSFFMLAFTKTKEPNLEFY